MMGFLNNCGRTWDITHKASEVVSNNYGLVHCNRFTVYLRRYNFLRVLYSHNKAQLMEAWVILLIILMTLKKTGMETCRGAEKRALQVLVFCKWPHVIDSFPVLQWWLSMVRPLVSSLLETNCLLICFLPIIRATTGILATPQAWSTTCEWA